MHSLKGRWCGFYQVKEKPPRTLIREGSLSIHSVAPHGSKKPAIKYRAYCYYRALILLHLPLLFDSNSLYKGRREVLLYLTSLFPLARCSGRRLEHHGRTHSGESNEQYVHVA